jgi:hypothetical protein
LIFLVTSLRSCLIDVWSAQGDNTHNQQGCPSSSARPAQTYH